MVAEVGSLDYFLTQAQVEINISKMRGGEIEQLRNAIRLLALALLEIERNNSLGVVQRHA